MNAFWSRGYQATSIQDLVDCMGIQRGSIYAAYGDKRSLFIKALHHYDHNLRKDFMTSLERENSPRQAIDKILEMAVAAAVSDKERRGCFLVNSALELSPHDPEIGEIVAKGLSETERFFCRMLEKGQQANDISADIDAKATSQALLAMMCGLRVLARSRPEKELLRTIKEQANAMLN